jgi:hypothetical protein
LFFEVNFCARREFIKDICITGRFCLRYLHLREPNIFVCNLTQWRFYYSSLNLRYFILSGLLFDLFFWKILNIWEVIFFLWLFNLLLDFSITEILQDFCLTTKN